MYPFVNIKTDKIITLTKGDDKKNLIRFKMQTTTYFVVYPSQNFRYLARVSDIDEVEMLASDMDNYDQFPCQTMDPWSTINMIEVNDDNIGHILRTFELSTINSVSVTFDSSGRLCFPDIS